MLLVIGCSAPDGFLSDPGPRYHEQRRWEHTPQSSASQGFASVPAPSRGDTPPEYDPHAHAGAGAGGAGGAGGFTTYLRPGEDLWIIARPARHDSRTYSDDYPRSGALVCETPDRGRVPVPLEHTAVSASIAGYIASVDVTTALAAVWARQHIKSLADRALWDAASEHHLATDIRQTALNFGLMSAYTSFIAVDSTYRTPGDHGYTVTQPVPVPDGTRYDTTVGR